MSDHATLGDLEELRRELRREREAREQAVKRLGDSLAEQLEQLETDLHHRIDAVHERALRELTRLHEKGRPQ